MSILLGAWLAAAAGGVTGALAAPMRRPAASSGSVIGHALLGIVLGTLVYGVFLAAGAAISLLTFSEPRAAVPALIGTAFVCVAVLLAAWLEPKLGTFAAHFGLPEPGRAFRERGFDAILEAQPQGGRTTMWIGGVGLALLPTIAGIQCLVTRKAALGSALWHRTLEGGAAIALGLGWIGVGAFLHFHFFFGLHATLSAHSYAGKKLALLVACAGLSIAMIWSMGTQ